MSTPISTSVQRCARCGDDHANLTFTALTRPGPRHSHWAPCPTNGEPIMMQVLDDPKRVKPRKGGK